MAKNGIEIPVELAIKLRGEGTMEFRSWPQVAHALKLRGFPQDPYPEYKPKSIPEAIRREKKRNAQIGNGYNVIPE